LFVIDALVYLEKMTNQLVTLEMQEEILSRDLLVFNLSHTPPTQLGYLQTAVAILVAAWRLHRNWLDEWDAMKNFNVLDIDIPTLKEKVMLR